MHVCCVWQAFFFAPACFAYGKLHVTDFACCFQADETEMGEKYTSWVWKHYTRVVKGERVVGGKYFCSQFMGIGKDGSTSPMIRHLASDKHRIGPKGPLPPKESIVKG